MSDANAVVTAAMISSIAPSLVGLVIAYALKKINKGQQDIHLMLNSQRDLLLDKLAASEERRATAEAQVADNNARSQEAANKVLDTATAAAKVLDTAKVKVEKES